jgi:hypothetical protein
MRGRKVEETQPETEPAQVQEPVEPAKSTEVMQFRRPVEHADKPKATYRQTECYG